MSVAPATGLATPANGLAASSTELETAADADPRDCNLSGLAPGTEAVIVAIEGGGPESLRLRDLGFVAGTRVRSIKRAPLGDPVVYDLRGTRLCLRRSESDRVRVRRD